MTLVRVPEDLLRRVVAHLPREMVNETAVPSYTHTNPLIRWLFRKRLETALELARIQGTDRVLDFGTGSGVLLASLVRMAGHVSATDLDVTPARQLIAALGLPVELVGPAEFPAWIASHTGQLDVIMALDVLEHLTAEELETVSAPLRALVAPGGRWWSAARRRAPRTSSAAASPASATRTTTAASSTSTRSCASTGGRRRRASFRSCRAPSC